MRKGILLCIIAIVSLISCEGSETYQGKWKATDVKGDKFEFTFTPDSFVIKDSPGESKEYQYLQTA